MDKKDILSKVDHTLLTQTATWEEIKEVCDDGMHFATASVCIPPIFVKQAKAYGKDALTVCTVIGFPNGYQTTETKCFEARNAVNNGADEIDMVISLNAVKEKRFSQVLTEINQVKAACSGRLLKVIVETCYLTTEEKIELCHIVSHSNADFIKTSTGFGTGGATVEDIQLFHAHITNGKQIKAAGGIQNFADAQAMIAAGAHRLGTSRLVKIMKEA